MNAYSLWGEITDFHFFGMYGKSTNHLNSQIFYHTFYDQFGIGAKSCPLAQNLNQMFN